MSGTAAELTISQAAERTGLSVHTLRFYEREGILLTDPVRRGAGSRRRYTEADVDWLNLCVILRASGMPLPAIREYTRLVRAGTGTEPERLALLREHENRVLGQITQLTRALDLIRYKVAVYEDFLDSRTPDHGSAPATG